MTIEQSFPRRVLTGLQPTNGLHIGNYIGALKPCVYLQNMTKEDELKSFFFIADLHAITNYSDAESLRNNVEELAAAYIASGISTEKSILFVQSAVPEHTELNWILGCFAQIGWVNRMTQFKDKAGKNRDGANLSLYNYPVLQAADVLLYKATHVPVGEDQKQHLELMRDIAGAFNRKFERDFFPLAEPQIRAEGARIMSLRDASKKMSKSDESDYSRINLTDDADTIVQKIRKATTDPLNLPDTVDGLAERPEAKNLLTIYAAMMDMPLSEVVTSHAEKTFAVFKKDLADMLVDKLAPIATRYNQLLDDRTELQRILNKGAEEARTIAKVTMKEVREIVGLQTPV